MGRGVGEVVTYGEVGEGVGERSRVWRRGIGREGRKVGGRRT